MIHFVKNLFNQNKDKWCKLEKKLFDKKYYNQMNPDLDRRCSFDHFHAVGWKEGRDPNDWFSVKKYLAVNPDVETANMDPFYHYLRYGIKENRNIFPSTTAENGFRAVDTCNNSSYQGIPQEILNFVDDSFYKQNYRDLRGISSAAEHYYLHGWKEGRDPNQNFSTEMFYLNNNIERTDIVPLMKVIYGTDKTYTITHSRVGLEKIDETSCINEINLCRGYIDEDYYAQKYGITEKQTEHFCAVGYKKNYNPNEWFDTKKYINENISLVNSGINPLYHYLKVGYKSSSISSKKVIKYRPAFELYKAVPLSVSPLVSYYKQYIEDITNRLSTNKKNYDKEHLYLHWIIPDFGKGGHLNIFRTIQFLEIKGFRCKIWIINPYHKDKTDAYCEITKFYVTVKADVDFLSFDNYPSDGDAIIATSWETVEWAKKIKSYQVLFYFIQDYEKYFFAKGSKYFLAENTYNEEFNCICASPWLEKILKEQFSRNTCSYLLGYDKKDFFIDKSIQKFSKLDGKKHIVVYTRILTERRAVELSLIALHLLAKKRKDFVVHCIGGNIDLKVAPFDYVLYNILTLKQLNNLYNACDIGVCFSATNYSLLPQEMMAAGLPILELDGDNTRSVFPPNIIRLTKPIPTQIMTNIEYMLDHENECKRNSENAQKWISEIPWEASYTKIKNFIAETVANGFADIGLTQIKQTNENNEIYASVVIPIFNPSEDFKDVLNKVCNQVTTWNYEVILIDSSTQDCKWCKDYTQISDKIVYHRINTNEFQHGRTRNLGVKISKGEFVAFITQDAMPFDNLWLYNLVTSLSKFDDVAIAFGKHYPYTNANSFVKRDINDCFENLLRYPLILSKNTDIIKYNRKDTGWMQLLHFYSDNNSCLKKKYWKIIPMRDVEFGEDQLLAFDMICAGHKKIYVPTAGVFHSHNFDERQMYERSKTEAWFFKKYFGYSLTNSYTKYSDLESVMNQIDLKYAEQNGICETELSAQYKLNHAKAKAYFGIPL